MRVFALSRLFWRPLVLASGLVLLPTVATPADPSPGPASTRASPLPSLGDGGEMTLSEERRLGDQIARQLYRDPDYLDDPVLDGYLQTLWQPLLAAARQRGDLPPELADRFAWQVLIGRDASVNAFALPGGYLGVHLGLIATVATADELVSVLAHELSHVTQRHIPRLIAQKGRQTPWLLASMVLGVLAASAAKNADIGNAAIVGGQAVAAQSQLNFSRDMEREADRLGFGVMTDAGFDGHGFVSMFDKLQQASRLNDDGAFPYLRSHPLTTERMADMQARAQPGGTPPSGSAARPVSPAYHAFMAARAGVLAETRTDRLQALAASLPDLKTPRQDATTLGRRYAATLAAARLRDGPRAWAGLALLRQTALADADAQRALDHLEIEIGTDLPPPPDSSARERLIPLRNDALAAPHRAGLLLAARAIAAAPDTASTPDLQPATQKLQAWTALHPQDAGAWQLLATLHRAQNQPVRAARADAEARLAQLDAPGALDRFKAAQQLARNRPQDHFELSILDARVRETERLVREQLRDTLGENARR